LGALRLLSIVGGVAFDELVPLRWEIFFGEDGGDGAFFCAEVAGYALCRIDVQHFSFLEIGFVFGRMDAINGTDGDAGRIFHADAGQCDYVCQFGPLLKLLDNLAAVRNITKRHNIYIFDNL
jgi:hypothetical protein